MPSSAKERSSTAHVQVEEACVLPGTYLGQNTRLFHAAAAGSELVDFRRGCRVEIAEPFVMSPVLARSPRPGVISRALASAVLALPGPSSPSCFSRKDPRESGPIRGLDGEEFDLHTRRTGPLLLRRVAWLKHIAAGRLRWVGILPRGAFELAQVPPEFVRALQSAPAGMFSLADVHGCHEPTDLEEWIHAAFQASAEGGNSGSLVLRNLVEDRMVATNQLIARLTYSEYAQCELSADLALVPEAAGRVRDSCLRRGLTRAPGRRWSWPWWKA